MHSQHLHRTHQPLAPSSDPTYQLELNRFDDCFFRRFIQENPPNLNTRTSRPSHKLLRSAYNCLNEHLERHLALAKPGTDPLSQLRRLATLLTENFGVVAIISDQDDQAASVFEALNDRGLRLQTADLLRNHLLSTAPKNSQNRMLDLWRDLTHSIRTPNLDNIIRLSWVSCHGDVKTRALYKEIRDRLKETKTRPLDYMQQLVEDADYIKGLATSNTACEAINAAAKNLKSLQATSAFAAMLAAHRKLDPKTQISVAQALVSLAVRHNVICGKSTAAYESAVFECAKLISSGAAPETALRTLRAISPPNEELASVYTRHRIRATHARVILREIEANRRPTKELQPAPPRQLHLEHIHPRRPSNHSNKRWDKYVNWLGNLTLLDKKINQRISNGSFSKKRKEYKHSQITLTQEIADKWSRWGPKAIRERHRFLLREIQRLWPANLI
jgi:hypothetical protein